MIARDELELSEKQRNVEIIVERKTVKNKFQNKEDEIVQRSLKLWC